MIIKKVLNNNAIVVQDKKETEKIITGKGIAFNRHSGDVVDESKIEKIFAIEDQATMGKFQQLVKNIPVEYLSLSETIIKYGSIKLDKKLNDTLYISLSDHIYSSIQRKLEGVIMPNPMLLDIRRFYPEEYEIGIYALSLIQQMTKIEMTEDEAGFIALHFVNAEMDQSNIENIMQITSVIQEITNIVKYTFKIDFDEESINYYRFITHLKFFAQRLVNHTLNTNGDESELLDIIKLKYINAYHCALKIQTFLENKYDYALTSEELLYLTIHIERVVYKKN